MSLQLKLLKQQQNDLRRKEKILYKVENFVRNAKTLGLEENRWSFYDDNIEDPVTFTEMEQILNQCANSSSYYFKPASLYVRRVSASDLKSEKTKASSGSSADSTDTKRSDMHLTLRGAFIVRHK